MLLLAKGSTDSLMQFSQRQRGRSLVVRGDHVAWESRGEKRAIGSVK